MIEIHLILFFMIAASLIAIEAKDLLSSIIGVGAAGIALSLGFLVLKAPDLAMMQVVVEILSLIILIRATIRKDLPFSVSGRWAFNTSVTIIFLVAFLTAAYFALKNIPAFGNANFRVLNYITKGPATGAKNIVASITLNFRALDTLGEAVVLFTAVIGILAIARKNGHKKET